MNIIDFLSSPKLFGAMAEFRDLSSWSSWIAVLKAIDGLPMTSAERATVEKLTGRSDFKEGERFRRVVLATGRQCGKSRIASLLQTFAALTEGAAGLFFPVLAQNRQASQRVLFSYIRAALMSSSLLAGEVAAETVDSLTLKNGAVVAVYPARPASLRGIRGHVVADEIAFASQGVDGRDQAREIVVAAEPVTATVDGRVVLLSSPGRSGDFFHRLVTRHWGVEGSEWLVVRASAPDLNPNLSAGYLRRMAEDGAAFRSEVLGDWNSETSALIDPATIAACTVSGRRDIAPDACPAPCRAYYDPSGGRHDRAALAIGFRDPESKRVVVAALRAWPSPHNPAAVAAEAAELAKTYKCKSITLDRYAGDTIAALIRAEGIAAEVSGVASSDLLMDLLPVVQSGGIEFPDPQAGTVAAELAAELASVERRPGGAGRDRADIPRGSGRTGHGDLAVSVAGLVSLLPLKKDRSALFGRIKPLVVQAPVLTGVYGNVAPIYDGI